MGTEEGNGTYERLRQDGEIKATAKARFVERNAALRLTGA